MHTCAIQRFFLVFPDGVMPFSKGRQVCSVQFFCHRPSLQDLRYFARLRRCLGSSRKVSCSGRRLLCCQERSWCEKRKLDVNLEIRKWAWVELSFDLEDNMTKLRPAQHSFLDSLQEDFFSCSFLFVFFWSLKRNHLGPYCYI